MFCSTRNGKRPVALVCTVHPRTERDDDVDVEVLGDGSVDEVQEASELEGAMTLGHVCDHLARGDVEGSVEARGAAPHVVVGSALAEP